MRKKISIIVPVYNVEKHIERCVRSILGQTYRELEIILVDNNSTDDSLRICEELQKTDERVKIFQQSVPGAAATRNFGLDKATGDYITFVDSDDYLADNAYETVVERLSDTAVDMVVFSYKYVDTNGDSLGWYEPIMSVAKLRTGVSGREACKVFLTSRDVEGFAWNKVFKRELLEKSGVRFDESKKAFEDIVFVFENLSKCRKVVFINEKLYYYRQVESSLVHQEFDSARYHEFDDAMQKIILLSKELGLEMEAISSYKYRKVLLYYPNRRSVAFPVAEMLPAIRLILKYQTTEKIKTLMKIFVMVLQCIIEKIRG